MATPKFTITPEKEAGTCQWFYRQFVAKTPPVSKNVDLRGKTAIVTGSNIGLGLETARQFLDLGLTKLIMAVRSEARGEAACKELLAGRDAGKCEIEVWKLDLSSYDSINLFIDRTKSLDRLDIAVLNAGLYKVDEAFTPSTGYEESVQVNYLSTVLLMTQLLPVLRAKAAGCPGRLVLVSSDTAGWVKFKERTSRPILAEFKKKVDKWDMAERYGTTKLMGQLYMTELAKRVSASAVIIDAVNPGLCYGTDLARGGKGTMVGPIVNLWFRIAGKPGPVGARSIVHAAVSFGQEAHGQYSGDGILRPGAPVIYKPEGKELGKRLWEETLSELSFAPLQECIDQVAA